MFSLSQRLAGIFARRISPPSVPPPGGDAATQPPTPPAPEPEVYAWDALDGANLLKIDHLSCTRLLFHASTPLRPGGLLDLELLFATTGVRLRGRINTHGQVDPGGYQGELHLLMDTRTRSTLSRCLSA